MPSNRFLFVLFLFLGVTMGVETNYLYFADSSCAPGALLIRTLSFSTSACNPAACNNGFQVVCTNFVPYNPPNQDLYASKADYPGSPICSVTPTSSSGYYLYGHCIDSYRIVCDNQNQWINQTYSDSKCINLVSQSFFPRLCNNGTYRSCGFGNPPVITPTTTTTAPTTTTGNTTRITTTPSSSSASCSSLQIYGIIIVYVLFLLSQ